MAPGIHTADGLQLSLRLTANICLDNAKILRELIAAPDRWPDSTVRQARMCCTKSEEIFAGVVRIYLRSLFERQTAHGGGSGG